MAIQKREYELSVWHESLNNDGIKEEQRILVIGAHDMSYLGRAVDIHFLTKLNGTHTLTFKMPDKYFDSEQGDFIQNEFRDSVVNENKIKLYYKEEWFEFFIKTVKQSKQFKSYMYEYSCSDAFIDELSRNGYGITFDTELYNNVEEIGIFSEEILDGSQWTYMPQYNWGDFTEYIEEKLFKIPVSQFTNLVGYKLNYETNSETKIKNIYTKKERNLELGDDLARQEGWFWDCSDSSKKIDLLSNAQSIENDGYIYVPYSQLSFCYVTTGETEIGNIITATEEPYQVEDSSYLLAPASIDPTSLIQFIAIPEDAEVEVDEAGLIVNKNYTYVMTVDQWNNNVKNSYWYTSEGEKDSSGDKKKEVVTTEPTKNSWLYNKGVTYVGYLDKIGNLEVEKGKKISISDRTEVNISDEIDQYVTVYKNESLDFYGLYNSPDWQGGTSGYKVCSKIATRQIVPQLARNYAENAVNISNVNGWEVQAKVNDQLKNSTSLGIWSKKDGNDNVIESALEITLSDLSPTLTDLTNEKYNTIVNFGAIGQEKQIEANKIYCLGLICDGPFVTGTYSPDKIIIGEGKIDSNGDYSYSTNISYTIASFIEDEDNNEYHSFIFIKPKKTIKNPYFFIRFSKNRGTSVIHLKEFWFFEAYTKGSDFYSGTLSYKYSGREMFNTEVNVAETSSYYRSKVMTKGEAQNKVIFETDTELTGDTYQYNQYFIQQLSLKNGDSGGIKQFDTFATKEYLSEDADDNTKTLPLSAGRFTEDDYDIITNYIDLNQCEYYKGNNEPAALDCAYHSGGAASHFCMYQKYGYCPYRFTTEKHCRKVRTLTGSKSNRFNLTQEIGKVFEVYPIYYTAHNDNGTYKVDENGKPIKQLFYITEKGNENKIGFRYEKNLADISRDLVSDQIVTKLYVEDNDSELSKTGLCSIKTAEDNPSKDNFIIDLRYYVQQGMLDKDQVEQDLYGIDGSGQGFLKKLGYYNTEYDKLSNLIINTTNESYGELEANLDVNLTGIETTLEEIAKIKKQMERYKITATSNIRVYTTPPQPDTLRTGLPYNTYINYGGTYYQIVDQNGLSTGTNLTNILHDSSRLRKITSDTYESYKVKLQEHQARLVSLLKDTFDISLDDWNEWNTSIKELKESSKIKNHDYQNGLLGQYNAEYNQIQKWKKQRAKYLKDINQISKEFFYRYEPYLKEGTWTDNNYITDNAYYHDAIAVAAEGAIPKVTYNIKVVPLGILDEDYEIGIADTSYIEDIGMFGINEKTGLPNRLKVIISEFNENLDKPTEDSITVQNFTTQFEDLFQQVTASVQSLTFNENIYKRSSNFTSNQNIAQDSLQGTLDSNNLTYLNTNESNIKLDQRGQSGSDINNHNNKYKLNGEGLWFSNNGGVTWTTGVGPNGINANYINTGTLDASNIRIVDGQYLYFLWDKNGITAYKDAQNLGNKVFGQDFVRFNKYGLSLAENNRIRLRAGYEFKGSNGNISTETNQGDDIGFYLYDDRGQTIFSTEAGSNSARLSLAGEMLATGDINKETGVGVYIYNQAKNNSNTPSSTSNYKQRLFSIVNITGSGNNKEVQNLLTVLKDGSLHMGGKLLPYTSGRNSINTLDDYVLVDGGTDNKGTIVMEEGTLYLDGTDLKSYVDRVKTTADEAANSASQASRDALDAIHRANNIINNVIPQMSNSVITIGQDVSELIRLVQQGSLISHYHYPQTTSLYNTNFTFTHTIGGGDSWNISGTNNYAIGPNEIETTYVLVSRRSGNTINIDAVPLNILLKNLSSEGYE